MTNQTAIEPVRKQIAVATRRRDCVQDVYRGHCQLVAGGRPLEHRRGHDPGVRAGERADACTSKRPTATEHDWATILVFEPPHRVVLEWKVNSAAPPTEVEVRFSAGRRRYAGRPRAPRLAPVPERRRRRARIVRLRLGVRARALPGGNVLSGCLRRLRRRAAARRRLRGERFDLRLELRVLCAQQLELSAERG